MVVHSGLYIPVSSSIHYSLLDLVIISPVIVLTLHMSLDLLPLNCAGTKPPSLGLSFHRSNSFGKQMSSSHVYVHVGACLFYHTEL